ncbi:hypothetical protein [Brucella intermedia]|uniref:hypothetical protein n=1 Tax=Brucella intermedia TaxID=94625 RepID=UPI0022488A1E|nr:hypothetical protein [Brucella intermedia]
MSVFKDPKINFNDQANGRYVTVTLNNLQLPNVSVTFLDPAQPDETNAAERVRVLGIAKQLFQSAASAL